MEIEKAPYEFPYLSPYWLLRETVNPNAKDKSGSHLLSGAVMRSILTGAPYPQALMNAVMLRIHAEQD
ncbi:UNVERIFIED_CONTAM: type I-C CRISPR-associated protein Cas8c/Csd1, partial [Prevotella sp. 15_C9]